MVQLIRGLQTQPVQYIYNIAIYWTKETCIMA